MQVAAAGSAATGVKKEQQRAWFLQRRAVLRDCLALGFVGGAHSRLCELIGQQPRLAGQHRPSPALQTLPQQGPFAGQQQLGQAFSDVPTPDNTAAASLLSETGRCSQAVLRSQ